MKMKCRKTAAAVCAVMMLASLMAGCSSGTGRQGNTGETETDAGGKEVSAAELAKEIRDEYSSRESTVYQDGQYEVPRDQKFTIRYDFDPEAAGLKSYDQIAALYSDQTLTNEIPENFEWTDDTHRSFTISPGKSPSTEMFKTDAGQTTPGYTSDGRFLFDKGENKDWGNIGTMYLAQWLDPATGRKLDKPSVTVITVKGELETPKVEFRATDDGIGQFSWDSVPGAKEYMILEYQKDDNTHTINANVIAETADTTWSDKVEEDSVSKDKWAANARFKNYLISDDDWLNPAEVKAFSSQYDPKNGPAKASSDVNNYYCVVAVSDSGTSMFSKEFSEDDISAKLPYTVAYEMEKQSENGFASYVNGIGMMPAYRWVVMCDGRLSQRLVHYDFDSAKQNDNTEYVYDKDDMSDMRAETVKTITVPYTVEGTPFGGTLTVENYDEKNWQAQLNKISERQKSLTSRTGTVERSVDVSGSKAMGKESSADTLAETNDKITSSTALGKYLAVSMISSEEMIDLSDFPEAGDPSYLADAWAEAIYQNPLVLGVSDGGLSQDRKTLYVKYEKDAVSRAKDQQAIREAVKKIDAKIISSDMTDMEKEYAINKYLCENAKYDDAALENAKKYDYKKVDASFNDSFNAYGILINKVGVCASYAASFKLLADEAGLDSVVVTGYLNGTMPHAWNRVDLNGKWDTLDVTNNDTDVIPNALLNIPDYALKSTLVEDSRFMLDTELSQYTSDDTESEYYRVNGKYYSEDEIAQKFAEQLKSNDRVVLRTDYALTDKQFYAIGSKVAGLINDEKLSGTYWMGTIVLEK